MKPIYNSLDGGADFKEHLAGREWTLAACLLITRQDGVKIGFTDHDQNISYLNNPAWVAPKCPDMVDVVYHGAFGHVPSNIHSSIELAVDNLSINGVFTLGGITRDDLLLGLYDHAEVRLFLINWKNPDMGVLPLPGCGWLGQVILRDQQFETELRGLAQVLQQPYGELFTRSCGANLGDERCKVVLADYTSAGMVTAVSSDKEFTAGLSGNLPASGEEEHWYTHGLVSWTSGGYPPWKRAPRFGAG